MTFFLSYSIIKRRMRKVKTFFHVLINSVIPQRDYYHKILKTPFSFSLKYFFFLSVIANFLFFFFLLLKISPGFIFSLKKGLINGLNNFPSDLVISLKNGSLNTNYGHPYFFWLKGSSKEILLLVVDESAQTSGINQYRSLILLTKNELVVGADKNNIIYKNYPPGLSLTINKESVNRLTATLTNLFGLIIVSILLVIFLICPLVSFFINLFYLLLSALISFFIFRLTPKKVTLNKIFQVGLHSSTFPVIFNYGFGAFNSNNSGFPMIYLFLLTVFLIAAINEVYFRTPPTLSAHLHQRLHRKK